MDEDLGDIVNVLGYIEDELSRIADALEELVKFKRGGS